MKEKVIKWVSISNYPMHDKLGDAQTNNLYQAPRARIPWYSATKRNSFENEKNNVALLGANN
jgi:hypothetical protein